MVVVGEKKRGCNDLNIVNAMKNVGWSAPLDFANAGTSCGGDARVVV